MNGRTKTVLQNHVDGGNLAPTLVIQRIGVVSRDYRQEYSNGYRDFSCHLADILRLLDSHDCDAVLFSLYSIVPRESNGIHAALRGLKKIQTVFLEEFEDDVSKPVGEQRRAGKFVTYYRSESKWSKYEVTQKFGTLTGKPIKEIEAFVTDELPRRVLGNACVLLCGETNGVKYSPKEKSVRDTFSLKKNLPETVKIILNPIHDRMTRFEMKLKRKFLSENNRLVVSVWNKGKGRDGTSPGWTAYSNGQAKSMVAVTHDFPSIEIGIVDAVIVS